MSELQVTGGYEPNDPVVMSREEYHAELERARIKEEPMSEQDKRTPDFLRGVETMRKRVEAILEDLQEQGRIEYPSEVFERVDRAAKKLSKQRRNT